ncbi:MAG: hypothetical protein ACK4UN_09730 [Limisphaerales bacterium]
MSLTPLGIKNPNDPTSTWHQTYEWVFDLILYLTADGKDAPTLPFGRTPTPDEDAACDAWLRKVIFLRELNETHLPSRPLMGWIFARLLVAREYVDSQIRGAAAPVSAKTGNDAMVYLLVDRWNEDLHKLWPEFVHDGKAVRFRDRLVLSQPGRFRWLIVGDEEDADPAAVTWKKVHNLAEMLSAALCQRARMQLPFGQLSTQEIDSRCDK